MAGKTLCFDFQIAGGGPSVNMRHTLAQIEVAQLAAEWEHGPLVEVVHSARDLPIAAPEDAVGLYYRRKVYVVASQPVENIARVLAHEALGHAGTRLALGKQGCRRFMLALRTAAMKGGNVFLRKLRARVVAAYIDPKGKQYLTPAQEGDEILAALAEQTFDRRTGRILIHDPIRKQAEALAAQAVREHLGVHIEVTCDQAEGMLIASEHTVRYGSPMWGAEYKAKRLYQTLLATAAAALTLCGWLFI